MPPTSVTEVACVFIIILALSTTAVSYLAKGMSGTYNHGRQTKQERRKRKKEIQKALKEKVWPKKPELVGRRRGAKIEVMSGGIGTYPDEENDDKTI